MELCLLNQLYEVILVLTQPYKDFHDFFLIKHTVDCGPSLGQLRVINLSQHDIDEL